MDRDQFQNEVESTARRLLDRELDPVVRFRLLRDCLDCRPGDAQIVALYSLLSSLPQVRELATEQQPDGSWGRFHSMDSKLRTRFTTSEAAIRRALALGLDRSHPILHKAVGYMQAVLEGRLAWSDRVEKSEGWSICTGAITAATLAQVDPDHPSIIPIWEYWVEVAQRSFLEGSYDPVREVRAHQSLSGKKALYLGSRYVLTLLGSTTRLLPDDLDRWIVKWILDRSDGIGYLGADLCKPEAFHIEQWLESHEILSAFRCWHQLAAPSVQWLWDQRDAQGLWDFGSHTSRTGYFPLSVDWRKPGNRQADHSVRVLSLLKKFADQRENQV